MKKSTLIILAIVAVVVVWAISGYNGLVSKEEGVTRHGQMSRAPTSVVQTLSPTS